MLGFAPLSTLPISTIPTSVAPSPSGATTGASAGSGRRLSAHERRRRRIHAQQMHEWRVKFLELQGYAELLPPARAAAAAIARQIEEADDPALVARREFIQWFPPDASLGQAILFPSDRGEVARDVQMRRQIADIAARLAAAIATERQRIEDDDDDVAAVLMML